MGELRMTLGEMRTLFGTYVSDPYFGYFTPSITLTFLNNALIQAQLRLLKMHAAYYSVCTSTTLVIGQSQYALPDDFLALFDAWIDLETATVPTETLPLNFIPLSQRHNFNQTNGTPTNFYMLKDSINLVCPPDTALTFELIYAYRVPALASDLDIPDVPEQFHEYIVLLAAKTAFMTDDRVSSLIDDEIKKYDDLISANEQRVQSQPRFIIEVG
jgi:hypothetical protein